MMSGPASLRAQLASGDLVRAMAAHSPLSAVLAQEAGFDAIWASGFELSALYGIADISLLSMTQHLEMTRAIADRCRLPVIADVDTGYGNAINVMHTVRQYERAGVAALVIEDKQFPKVTSLREGGRQLLVEVPEFCGKIDAALNARTAGEMLIVARTEALIAGRGESEALARARAYADAGADLILVHSRQRTPAEIESFIEQWDRAQRLVLVPTSYPQLDSARLRSLTRVGVVIYGNHGIRAVVRALRKTFATIIRDGGATGVLNEIATVDEVFELQQMDQVARDELRFLR
jgi:phosphoenolpyruvate phosphomutase